jgi:hypothetical protein
MGSGSGLLNARSVRALDIGLVVWLVVWIVLGVVIWSDIRAQSKLSESVVKAGDAISQTGEAIDALSAIPLVGSGLRGLSERILRIGSEVETSGSESRDGIQRIALIAGIGVGVLPAALVLLVYLPMRLAWRRDVGSLARALPAAAGDPAFERYLAQRALTTLTWDQLRALSADPWADLERGDTRALADAELRRLGLSR